MKSIIKNGFTVIELIIVIAILGVLAAIGIPSFIALTSDSAAEVCHNNRVMIMRVYNAKHTLNPELTLEEVLLNENNQYFKNEVKCTHGGQLSAVTFEDGSCGITCTKHQDGIVTQNGTVIDFANLPEGNIRYGKGWNVAEMNGKKVLVCLSTDGESRFLLKNSLSEYQLDSKVTLNSGSGYGIYFETKSDNNGHNAAGYTFQFDYARKRLTVTQRKGYDETMIADYNQFIDWKAAFGDEFWNTTHDVSLSVTESAKNKKVVNIIIDGVAVNKEPIEIDANKGANNYVGYRSWLDGASTIEEIKITDLSVSK